MTHKHTQYSLDYSGNISVFFFFVFLLILVVRLMSVNFSVCLMHMQ